MQTQPRTWILLLTRVRLQDEKNRQNSVEIDDPKLQEEWDTLQEMVIEDAQSAYRWAISKGIAKGTGDRAVLPRGSYHVPHVHERVHYDHGFTTSNFVVVMERRKNTWILPESVVAIAPIFPMIQDFVNE